jgi:hypothetical protein
MLEDVLAAAIVMILTPGWAIALLAISAYI